MKSQLIKRSNATLEVLRKQQALVSRRTRIATIRQAIESLCYIQQDMARTPKRKETSERGMPRT